MSLLSSLLPGRRRQPASTEARALSTGLDTLVLTWPNSGTDERLAHDFQTYVTQGYQANGIVFGCILARLLLFSEATFQWRNTTTKALFGTPELRLLEQPWTGGTTGELLARMEQDASLAGNAYVRRVGTRLERLRPDWVTIFVLPVRYGDAVVDEVIGYGYSPLGSRDDMQLVLPEEMAHWSPIPDPLASYRGMSWLTPVVREIDADTSMTRHKGKFFDNAATPNAVVKAESVLPREVRERLREEVAQRHEGVDNAYKTMIIDAGADFTVVGHSFEQMSFATVQAAGENRIAAAAGVPGIVVGLKEGLQAATYSNYAQAMRRFADLTMRPNWRSAAGALGRLLTAPAGAHLWFDTTDITALKEGERERAEITKLRAETAQVLVAAGYDPAQAAQVAATGEGMAALAFTGTPAALPAPTPGAPA